jgi:RimJ/RimL family protein N-acetyltransferase
LKFYFDELRYQKVTVSVHGDNLPSIHLHESLGFRLEGRLRRMVFTEGAHDDELWFGMTCEEYREQRAKPTGPDTRQVH